MLENQIQNLIERTKNKELIETEEATKNAFVLPFINSLGYDIFNPLEVVPEFIADIGKKKGEKVDYCIKKDNNPIILIECKHWRQNLDLHNTQLQRYFHVTKARFAILTNGISYRFYSDLDKPNIMDTKPFLEFNLESYKPNVISQIKKFHKESFNVENILSTASELKYVQGIKSIVEKELVDPSNDFIKFLVNQVYEGKLTSKKVSQFTPLVKKSISLVLTERVNKRLEIAQQKEIEQQAQDQAEKEETKESKINTTQKEIEAFLLIKSILRRKVEANRIFYKDAQSYFSILLDDNNRKKICRLFLESSKWYIVLFSDDGSENKQPIQTLYDIFKYSNQLIETALKYIDN